jgi:Ser/Thr protein kinase RdoA (MazF antagonist)
MTYKKSGQFGADRTAVAAALRPYGITKFAFVAATRGIENTTLIITLPDASQRVLRVYRLGKKSDADILLELAFMQELREHGLPIPAIAPSQSGELLGHVDAGDEQWQCVLMEYLGGHHTKHYSPVLIEELARYQAHMHQLGAIWATTQPPGTPMISELTETEFVPLVAVSHIPDPALRAFIERAAAYRFALPDDLPHGYSHFDYDSGNVLVDESGHVTGILDFDDMRYAPLVMCLAYSLWDVRRRNPSSTIDMEAYLHTYQQLRPLTVAERTSLASIMLLRHYAIGALKVLSSSMDAEVLRDFLHIEQRLIDQIATS